MIIVNQVFVLILKIRVDSEGFMVLAFTGVLILFYGIPFITVCLCFLIKVSSQED